MIREPGDQVSAATLNNSGFIRCEALRVGEDTTLSQIIQMVSDAAATKAPIAKVADQSVRCFCAGGNFYCCSDDHWYGFCSGRLLDLLWQEEFLFW